MCTEYNIIKFHRSSLSGCIWGSYVLGWKSANFFSKEIDSKYIRLYEPYSIYHSYSVLLVQSESHHRQYINEWMVCVPISLFKKAMGSGPDVATGPHLPTTALEGRQRSGRQSLDAYPKALFWPVNIPMYDSILEEDTPSKSADFRKSRMSSNILTTWLQCKGRQVWPVAESIAFGVRWTYLPMGARLPSVLGNSF